MSAAGEPRGAVHGGPADLVVYDVDGTLHDAFGWWHETLVRGLQAFAARHGIELDPPTREQADAVVGQPDLGVWAPFLPEGMRDTHWAELKELTIPLECEVLTSGEDHLYPGVRSLLARVRAAGVPQALASNCRGAYMDAMCRGQGLGPAVEMHFCLDSPGITDKASMLAAARRRIEEAGGVVGRPVMVGDRESDLEAARANGFAFVWRANDRCDLAEDADRIWDGDPDGLLGFLGLAGPAV